MKFIQAYEAKGIPINYLAVQNEPLYETSGYPTMFMTPRDEGNSSAIILGRLSEHSPSRIADGTSRSRTTIRTMRRPVFWATSITGTIRCIRSFCCAILRCAPYLAGVSFHCYAGDVAAAQDAIHDLQPGTPVWFTECTGGYYAPVFSSNLLLVET